jgi:hypothetical protein
MKTPMKNPELWKRLQEFNIDDQNSSFTLTQRLARENGWSIDYAKRVIEEYRRFLYLSVTENGSMTPSDEVDQAWHLHMLYTESYWSELCGQVIGKKIGHGPTKGGSSERVKYNDQYNKTLELYKEVFGADAPADIWPNAEKRFSNIKYQRVNMHENIVLNKSKVREYMAIYVMAPIMALIAAVLMSADGEGDGDNFGGILLTFILIMLGIFLIRGIVRYSNRKNRKKNSHSSSSSSPGNRYDDDDGCSILSSFFGCGSSGCSSCDSGCGGCGGCGGCD